MLMWCCLQRITCTFNSKEQKRLLMDLDVNMRTGSCPYAVKFYGALFREVSQSLAARTNFVIDFMVLHVSTVCFHSIVFTLLSNCTVLQITVCSIMDLICTVQF